MSEEDYRDPDEGDFTDKESRSRAFEDLEAIQQLKSSRPFQKYFLRRLHDKIRTLESIILDEKTPEAEIGKLKSALKALRDIARMTEEDEAGCRSIIGPVTPEEER